jgi:hypothetical protein
MPARAHSLRRTAGVLGKRLVEIKEAGDRACAIAPLDHALTLYEPTDHSPGVTRFATDMRVIVRVFFWRACRFTEGFDTADLVAAKGLLRVLRTGSP